MNQYKRSIWIILFVRYYPKITYRRVFHPASLYRRDIAGRQTKWIGKTSLRRTLPT